MKNNLKFLLMCAAFICASAISDFAQMRTGGYKKVAANDAGVVAAAEFAAQTQSEKDGAEITLQSVETAKRQTVAGTNYKLCLEVFRVEADDNVEVRQFVQTIVFLNLKKQYTLKSWESAEDCGK